MQINYNHSPDQNNVAQKSMGYLSTDMRYGQSQSPRLMNACMFVFFLCSLTLSLQTSFSLLTKIEQPFLRLGVTEHLRISPFALSHFTAEKKNDLAWAHIEAVNSQKISTVLDLQRILASKRAGNVLSLQLKTVDNKKIVFESQLNQLTGIEILDSPLIFVFLGLLFIFLGFALYFFRPGFYISFSFTLFMVNIGLVLTSIVDETFFWSTQPLFAIFASFLPFTGFLLTGFLSGVLQPEKNTRGRGSKLHLSSLITSIVILCVSIFIALLHTLSLKNLETFFVIDVLLFIWMAVGAFVAFFMMVYTIGRITSQRQKIRLKQIMWSIPIGIGIPLLNAVYAKVTQSEGIFMLNFGLLVIPLVISDAIVRYELFSFNHHSREVIAKFLLLFTVAVLFTVSVSIVIWYFEIVNRYMFVFIVFLITLGGVPLTLKWHDYINSFLENRRYSSRKILADFNHQISFALNDQKLIDVLHQCLDNSVQPRQFTVLRSHQNGELLEALLAESSLEVDSVLRAQLMLYAAAEHPVEFDSQNVPTMDWVKIVMPLRIANQLEGMLLLGVSRRHDFYLSNDLNFISSLNGPLSAALIHVRTFKEIRNLNADLEQKVQDRTQELEQSNQQLMESNRHKDDLVATVSHDFRSPLAIIRQNTQTILRDLKIMNGADLKYFLESISRQEARLSEMSENLLDLARLKQNSVIYKKISLLKLVKSSIEDVQIVADAKNIKLELIFDTAESYTILGDALQIKQCLQNLISNALKFTEESGDIHISLEETATQIVLCVEDNGVGIPVQSISRLFDAFYQAENQDQKMKGSGLGLAIVKQIVEGHHGQIAVESTEKIGTKFRLSFPKIFTSDDLK